MTGMGPETTTAPDRAPDGDAPVRDTPVRDTSIHDAPAHSVPPARLDAGNAAKVAATMQALATPSRLLILARLREGPCPASELAAAVGLEQSACSHQLRLLRNLDLVVGERQGRSVVYDLYDHHVAELLDQAVYHVNHLRA